MKKKKKFLDFCRDIFSPRHPSSHKKEWWQREKKQRSFSGRNDKKTISGNNFYRVAKTRTQKK